MASPRPRCSSCRRWPGSSSTAADRGANRAQRRWYADRFRFGAQAVTDAVGTPWAMLAAASVIVVWAVTGPVFGFSDTWQLVINTGTTIVTFLMVFAIQASHNREAKAVHLKVDELIRATRGARNALIDEEHETEARLRADEAKARRVAHRGRR